MKIAVGKTGHEIADRVADSFKMGFGNCTDANVFIGYGILRGMAEQFKKYEHFFNIDRGYFKPGHYDGYYRISYRGTQATSNFPEPDYDRWHALGLKFQPWRGFDHSKPVLVCPPTDAVEEFFGIHGWRTFPKNEIIRKKGDPNPINFQDYSYVVTFNSSVGWQALQAGIPCVSDPTRSIVGSYFKNLSLDGLSKAQYLDREKLFGCMSAMQFTLEEVRDGKACGLINHYLSS